MNNSSIKLYALLIMVFFKNLATCLESNHKDQESIQKHNTIANLCPQFSPYCDCFTNYEIDCRNFRNLSELNITTYVSQGITLSPLEPIIIDASLNLSNIELSETYETFEFQLENILGIDIASNPLQKQDAKYSIIILNSSFKLFSNNILITKENCDLNTINTLFKHTDILSFANFSILSNICPFVFHNSNITTLYLEKPLQINGLSFIDASKDELSRIESNINIFVIDGADLDLNDRFLNTYIFKNLQKMLISYSNVTISQIDVFKNFKEIKQLEFGLYNFREFVRNYMDALNYLNYDLNVDLNNRDNVFKFSDRQIALIFQDGSFKYRYQEEDFVISIRSHLKNWFFPLYFQRTS